MNSLAAFQLFNLLCPASNTDLSGGSMSRIIYLSVRFMNLGVEACRTRVRMRGKNVVV